MDAATVQQRLREDPDFIALPKYRFSLLRVERKFPDGVPPVLAAEALASTEGEVEQMYGEIVGALREKLEARPL